MGETRRRRHPPPPPPVGRFLRGLLESGLRLESIRVYLAATDRKPPARTHPQAREKANRNRPTCHRKARKKKKKGLTIILRAQAELATDDDTRTDVTTRRESSLPLIEDWGSFGA